MHAFAPVTKSRSMSLPGASSFAFRPTSCSAARPRGWRRRRFRQRGYLALYATHVNQAPDGCDFDFLNTRAPVAEPEIH